jgi:hypothetical protein
MSKDHELITILDTIDQTIVAVLKTALDNEKIPYLVKGELLYRNRSFQVQVNQADEKRVRQILKKFNDNKSSSP